MTLVRIILIACMVGLAACGGSNDLTCDDGPYLSAERMPRVETPEDLDSLEQLRERPLPAASPRPDRPAGSPCLDRPPTTIGSSGD